ncbi:MAG: hypothetical protein IPP77_00770 [Bacteroidetes bacterium]|nr:hypothetical protein [Bacteroidota bacterium]
MRKRNSEASAAVGASFIHRKINIMYVTNNHNVSCLLVTFAVQLAFGKLNTIKGERGRIELFISQKIYNQYCQ